ncbi:amine oxidase, flavin-containing superfamily [Talaromyces proteolyticus]|uniref:Amine oxidase, flavin-containing superfamily n=1 Tax=Talaromyces proteolyticus TaxID=1131652 RepID=A0AAD4KTU9_9EURO|nr:amine oxidase, flavin-containing superfamily [Talaromyces proteolyticus]KAH8700753.1 amine oxidase, flavin-containing superfamily [Talaromyces proteolyticus]
MKKYTRVSLKLITFGLWRISAGLAERVNLDSINCATESIITRDVAVIGGGSSGTYAAIRLRDIGQSVVVVERNDRLGGHTHTYTDPVTKGKIDIGVEIWQDWDIVRNFFSRFKISLTKNEFAPSAVQYVDYRTGQLVSQYSPGNATDALTAYATQLAKYPYLEFGFDLPNPVPTDLLLPFGDFVEKYALDDTVPTIFKYAQGLGNILHQPTLYVMKNFGLVDLKSIQEGFLTTAKHDNSEIYERALAELGDNALLNTSIVATKRSITGYSSITVTTPCGRREIRAKKILLAIPPKLDNLDGFDLDATEKSLFQQFGNSAYYTGVLRYTGINDNTTVQNIGINTTYHLPVLPGIYSISPSVIPGLLNVKYGSPTALADVQVQSDIIASVQRLPNRTISVESPEFAIFASHTPFELTVSSSAIESGFYKRLYAMQGKRSTYYTGAAFHTQDSSLLWRFTEQLLPLIVEK